MRVEPSDQDVTEAWRFEQALNLGASEEEADTFASSKGDLETLRRIVAGGCDVHTACSILS